MKETVKTYIDMDGVLAQFEQEPNALERFAHEKGFFASLKPTKYVQEFNALLSASGVEGYYILTSSPNEQADRDKRAWLEQYVPLLANRMIITRSGEAKSEYAQGNYLLDDYTDNLKHWHAKGGKAIKALNGINGKSGRYKEFAHYLRVDW